MSGTNITAPAERRFSLYLCSKLALHKHVATNCGDQIRQKLSLQRQIIHCTLIATNFNAGNWMQLPLAVQAAKNLRGQSVQLPASSMCADMRIERGKGGYKNRQWTSTSREKLLIFLLQSSSVQSLWRGLGTPPVQSPDRDVMKEATSLLMHSNVLSFKSSLAVKDLPTPTH
jgi:hypothetical protein